MLYYREQKKYRTYKSHTGKALVLLGTVLWISCLFPDPSVRTIQAPSSAHIAPLESVSALPPAPSPPPESSTFTQPAVGVLTSPFGERWGKTHTGIDIGGVDGSDILAAASGKVLFSGWLDGYGNYLLLEHKKGFSTAYAHCKELLVKEGEQVSSGQLIAYMGSTGNSTGPHLHFEIKLDGVYQDPLQYVEY